jgi:hypothetical protein
MQNHGTAFRAIAPRKRRTVPRITLPRIVIAVSLVALALPLSGMQMRGHKAAKRSVAGEAFSTRWPEASIAVKPTAKDWPTRDDAMTRLTIAMGGKPILPEPVKQAEPAKPAEPAIQTIEVKPQRNAAEVLASLTGGVVTNQAWDSFAATEITGSIKRQAIAPQPRTRPSEKTDLVKFATAPFPNGTGRYGDNRVLLHIPAKFRADKPAVMVVFFHGHGAELERDVLNRQQVAAQISASDVNAVLVAPQFAVDARDSNPGRFAEPNGFAQFLAEASKKLKAMYWDPKRARQFDNMPVVIVAYSGGYFAAAKVIEKGGIGKRLHGVVLLDALYGELNTFAQWVKTSPRSFFVSAYTDSTRRHNAEFAKALKDLRVRYSDTLENHLWRGRVALLSTDPEAVNHRDFVTRAWTENPIQDVLAKMK